MGYLGHEEKFFWCATLSAMAGLMFDDGLGGATLVFFPAALV
jgi:hypothetical protein